MLAQVIRWRIDLWFESCALIQSIKSSGKVKLAADDVRGAIELWPLWVRLGWNDILYRYRRSTLGPFWFTASMAITIVALGSVYSQVLRLPARELMPHVCVGLIVWAFMNSTVLEAGDLFTGSESYIKHVKLPYSLYVFRFVLSKTIIFAHDFPIYLATIAYFGIWPGPVAFYAIPGFLLLVINGVLITISLGMASARFQISRALSPVFPKSFFLSRRSSGCPACSESAAILPRQILFFT